MSFLVQAYRDADRLSPFDSSQYLATAEVEPVAVSESQKIIFNSAVRLVQSHRPSLP